MDNYCINTSADSLYFSRVINLIGSVRQNFNPNVNIVVWDLGLTNIQKYTLKLIGVNVGTINQNTKHWKQCYSWKLYVYQQSSEDVFFHLDAGNIVLKDLSSIFIEIEKNGMFLIDQGQTIKDIVPLDYVDLFNPTVNLNDEIFAAGNIGLNKRNEMIKCVINETYTASVQGYCLGYSETEQFRDTENINIVRNCKVFRHDQSVINIIMRKFFKVLKLNSHDIYAAIKMSKDTCIFNHRGYHYGFIIRSGPVLITIPLLIYCYSIDFYRRVFRAIISMKGKWIFSWTIK